MDLYEVLGVSKDATAAQIGKAYRKKSMRCHPDRHPNDPDKAEEFKKLAEAFEILNDPERRARYDQFGDIEIEPEDPMRGAVLSVLSQTFMSALTNLLGQRGDPAKHNLIELMKSNIVNSKHNHEQTIKINQRSIDTYEGIAKRFSRIGEGENIMASIARQNIPSLRAELEQSKEAITILDLAFIEVGNFVYAYDRETNFTNGWGKYGRMRNAYLEINDHVMIVNEMPKIAWYNPDPNQP